MLFSFRAWSSLDEGLKGMQKQLKLSNRIEELEKIKDAIRELLQNQSAETTAEFEMNLISEELFVNVVHYAFSDNAPHEILVNLSVDAEKWEIVIEDDGIPFDPTKAPEADTSLPLMERGIGGLGIHLVRQTADIFLYERKANHNIVCVRKKLI
jgi:anti-sigma regulatory factor (Ser/Thr protein kinase)